MFLKSIVKSVAAVAVAAAALATGAEADGLPRRGSVKDAPYYAPVPFSWSGFYGGVNLGYAWADTDYGLAATGAWAGVPADAAWLAANGSPSVATDGWLGGIQAGFNLQSGGLVYGIEGDFNFMGADGSSSTPLLLRPSGFPTSFAESSSVDWLFTLRGRLGVTITPMMLLYATGGLAIADVNTTQTIAFPGVPGAATFSESGTRTGWTLGAGLEWALDRKWSLKAEYLYVDLGSKDGGSFITNAATFTHSHSTDLTMSVARIGLNYRF